MPRDTPAMLGGGLESDAHVNEDNGVGNANSDGHRDDTGVRDLIGKLSIGRLSVSLFGSVSEFSRGRPDGARFAWC